MSRVILRPLAEVFLQLTISENDPPYRLEERDLQTDLFDAVGDMKMWSGLYPLSGTTQYVQFSLRQIKQAIHLLGENGEINPLEAPRFISGEQLKSWFGAVAVPLNPTPVLPFVEIKKRSQCIVEGLCDSIFDIVRWDVNPALH